ncbi:MAG: hypothetical protein LBB67_02805 [Oscillospiraceae bacterium]|jgi:Na+-translocating ferredoxin:NAD+ oxidoreductase RnfA subunit|nr:hypothetical protein [Oscillospiraceae bacterium]
MKDLIVAMLNEAIFAVFLQNLVFSGGIGATETIRVAQKNGELSFLSLAITFFSVVAGVGSNLLRRVLFGTDTPGFALAALLFSGVLLAAYFLVCAFVLAIRPKSKKFLLRRMGLAALNTVVLSVPLLAFRMGSTLSDTIALGIGAGVAFALASMLINSGMHQLQKNESISPMFRGVPATLLYVGLLALAFTGFRGTTLFG